MSEEKKIIEMEQVNDEATEMETEIVDLGEEKKVPLRKRAWAFTKRNGKKLALIGAGAGLTFVGYMLGHKGSDDDYEITVDTEVSEPIETEITIE